MKYKIEKNVYLAQPEIKTKQDEKQLLSFIFSRCVMNCRNSINVFEYDTQIALENRKLSSDTLTVNFPNSAIVSLRHTKNTPKVMTIRVNTPGGAVSYIVPGFLDMSRKVIENLAVKYENVAKEVCRQMGGKVLNYEAKDILNRGRAEGEAEGIARMQRAAKLLRMGKSISDVAELTELSEETVTELAQTVEG